jgi:peptide/nickel transport system substrate-binding protein
MKKKVSLSTLACISLALCFVVSISMAQTKAVSPVKPQYGGTLRISVSPDTKTGLGNPPTNMDQLSPQFTRCTIENLVRLDETGAPIPWLATAWKINAAAKTITLTLRRGVKFHDGTDFNAQAVKWNLDRYGATKRAELAAVSSIDVVDNYTVRLNLSKIDNLLIPYLSVIPGMMISPTAYEKAGSNDKERTEWAEKNPVGTGPFQLVSWQKDVGQEYKKFNGYWQKGKPYLDRIEYKIIADPVTQMADFIKGDSDIVLNLDISPKNAKDLEKAGKYNIVKSKLLAGVQTLMPDSLHPNSAYANLKVRQAVWHAIDFQTICGTIGNGYWEPINQYAAPGSIAYNPKVKGYPYNPARAKQLLSEAGYPNGFKTTIFGLNDPTTEDLMLAIQGYLKVVGIDAQVEPVESSKFAQMVVGGGGWKDALCIIPIIPVPNELGGLSRILGPEVHAARAPVLFAPDEFTKPIGQAVTAPDLKSMKARIHEAQLAGTDKYAVTPWIYGTIRVVGKQLKVKGDHMGDIDTKQWTPEDAWIQK